MKFALFSYKVILLVYNIKQVFYQRWVNKVEIFEFHSFTYATIGEVISDFITQNALVIVLGMLLFIFLAGFIVSLIFKILRLKASKVAEMAYTDELTGLQSIAWFEEKVPEILQKNSKGKYVLVSFDIRHFNSINEFYGRSTGDKILKKIAAVINRAAPSYGMIPSRMRADRFIILAPFDTKDVLINVVHEISKDIGVYTNRDLVIKYELNFGVYIIEDNNVNILEAIDNAEIARQETLNAPNKNIIFFDSDMADKIKRVKNIESVQETALKNGEFEVYYQPKYNMHDASIIGAEALIRWNSKERGFMNPGLFIPVFEKNGFVVQIDFFVLEETCKLLRRRIDSGLPVVVVSVNQSRVHFSQEDYLARLKAIIDQYAIPKGLIELEITESTFSESDNALKLINQIRAIGFKTSMDDFGTGYSSLTMLNRIPLDTLKIDKGFMDEAEKSDRAKKIITVIVLMAQALNMNLICEGIETQTQVNFLLSLGVKYAQGYFYSKPVNRQMFELKLEENYKMIQNRRW